MNDPMKEVEEFRVMNEWIGKNIDKLPFAYRIKFKNAMVNFCNELKSIYLAGSVLLGNSGEGSGGSEGGEN